MNGDLQRIMREYNVPVRSMQVPEGVLSPEELRLLRDGGIKDSDSEFHEDDGYRRTNPRGAHAVEIETLKSVHANQLSMKEKQIQFLQAELGRRDHLLELERQKLRNDLIQEQERMGNELRLARAQIIKTESQIPLIKEALAEVRNMLSGITPESVYLRLRDIPERDLPPSEWILVSVWEMCYPFKKQAEQQKKQIGRLRDDLKVANDKQHSILGQLQHYSRLLASKDDDEKRHLLNFENSRKSMELELQKCREEVELLREKGARYDELLRDYNFTKQEKQLLEEKMGFYNKATSGGDGKGKMALIEDNQARKMDLLTQDKEYLTKENIQLLEKNKRVEDRLDRLETELLNEKNRSQEYLHQLLNLKTDSISSYEQRIYKEISELKEKHGAELQATKNNLIDIYEKQLRFVKEALEEKELKLQNVERELRERSKDSEQLLIDHRAFQRKLQTDMAQTRVSLKIKSEQLDRMGGIYQETLSNLKAHKLENEMLREKVNLLKAEFYKSEANAKDSHSSLRAQVAVMKEQLANYQLIEKEIDEAVVSLSNLKPNENNIYLNTLNSVPTSNKRRIQQALGLAQRLQAKQRDMDEVVERLRLKQQECEHLKDEVRVNRDLLSKTNQPSSYLINTIEEKEKEILLLRNANRKKEQDYENMREEYNHMKAQLDQAETDIKRLLIKRENIQNIQQLLVGLAAGTSSKADVAGVVQEIQDILGGTRQQFHQRRQAQSAPKHLDDGRSNLPLWYQKLAEKRKK